MEVLGGGRVEEVVEDAFQQDFSERMGMGGPKKRTKKAVEMW